MLRNGYYIWIIILLIVATWQLGQGFYIQAKAYLAQALLEKAWTETRNGAQQVTPWPWADTWPVARLSVPRLGVNLIVLAGDTGRTLAFGPGHNFASAKPGESGNSVISGHRDTHFEFLQHIQDGDQIIIEPIRGKSKVYLVVQQKIVNEQQGYLPIDENFPGINLITCYPFNSIHPGATQRYIVTARDIDSLQSTNI